MMKRRADIQMQTHCMLTKLLPTVDQILAGDHQTHDDVVFDGP